MKYYWHRKYEYEYRISKKNNLSSLFVFVDHVQILYWMVRTLTMTIQEWWHMPLLSNPIPHLNSMAKIIHVQVSSNGC